MINEYDIEPRPFMDGVDEEEKQWDADTARFEADRDDPKEREDEE